jgi:hypothetical protein
LLRFGFAVLINYSRGAWRCAMTDDHANAAGIARDIADAEVKIGSP